MQECGDPGISQEDRRVLQSTELPCFPARSVDSDYKPKPGSPRGTQAVLPITSFLSNIIYHPSSIHLFLKYYKYEKCNRVLTVSKWTLISPQHDLHNPFLFGSVCFPLHPGKPAEASRTKCTNTFPALKPYPGCGCWNAPSGKKLNFFLLCCCLFMQWGISSWCLVVITPLAKFFFFFYHFNNSNNLFWIIAPFCFF